MRTDSIGSHWLVELGWVIVTGFIAVATLDLLAKVIVAPTVQRPLPTAARLAPFERSRPTLDLVGLSRITGLSVPQDGHRFDLAGRDTWSPPTEDPLFRVREVAENTYVVEALRPELSGTCSIPPARVLPAFRNGRPVGFQLRAIRPGSLLAGLGFVDGDVILHINGLAVDSPEAALAVYSRLKEVTRFEVDLERSDRSIRKTCTFHSAATGELLSPSPRPP